MEEHKVVILGSGIAGMTGWYLFKKRRTRCPSS